MMRRQRRTRGGAVRPGTLRRKQKRCCWRPSPPSNIPILRRPRARSIGVGGRKGRVCGVARTCQKAPWRARGTVRGPHLCRPAPALRTRLPEIVPGAGDAQCRVSIGAGRQCTQHWAPAALDLGLPLSRAGRRSAQHRVRSEPMLVRTCPERFLKAGTRHVCTAGEIAPRGGSISQC